MKLYRISALLLKYYYITINRFDRIFDLFYWPIIDIIIWGLASNYIEILSDFNVLGMILGGIMLWGFLWRASQDTAVFVLEDFWSRNLYHLFSSPVRINEHVVSILLLGFLRATVSFLFLGLAVLLIYSFNILSLNLLFLASAIFLLSLFGWAMGLIVTGMIFRFGKRIQVLAWSLTVIVQPFSCIFYPLSSLPSWAATIAKYNPLTYIFENLRSLLYQGTVNYGQLGYTLTINLFLLLAAGWYMKNSFQKAKITGGLAKGD